MPDDDACDHKWRIYDVYWVSPNLGNQRCEVCGERQKGIALSDQQVADYLERQETSDGR